MKNGIFWLIALFALPPSLTAAEDILIADFEGADYGGWLVEGEAFGAGPARGSLPNQMRVEGFQGKGLVNSFLHGDGAIGKLASPAFKIERRYLRFLIGGGGHGEKTCIRLRVGDEVVRTATGPNTKPGGSEVLDSAEWDVKEFMGREAVVEIVDAATGGWGHINVDHIIQTDQKLPRMLADVSRSVTLERKYLRFPVKIGAPKRILTVSIDGGPERKFDITLADGAADWWASMDVGGFAGRTAVISADRLPENSEGLASIDQGDEIKGAENLYGEPLRPQIHFSPRRGWNNDPNGLVYFRGEYHLFFQHNPYGTSWGNMHWGHAVSRDLVRWQEVDIALYPDEMGPMFSGSAVVDWNNTGGFSSDDKPPIVLFYTAAGSPTVQGLAYSVDGRNFTKFSGNPIVKEFTPGNRDPKVIWHEPMKRWVMVLYVGEKEAGKKDHKGRDGQADYIYFLGSSDLRNWIFLSKIEAFYECPDFFHMPIEGKAGMRKWVLTAANSDYMLGTFDGTSFKPETPMLKGHRGKGFYAAQTFSDIPPEEDRRIQIGWFQAPSPGMPFNQAMTLPLELTLHEMPEGVRLAWRPVSEIKELRAESLSAGPLALKPGDPDPLGKFSGELMELRAEFDVAGAARLRFEVRGIPIVYDTGRGQILVGGLTADAPLRNGRGNIAIYTDRTAFEIFADGGLTYVPVPAVANTEDRSLHLTVTGGDVAFRALDVHRLRSIWDAAK